MARQSAKAIAAIANGIASIQSTGDVWLKRKIVPKLDAFSAREIADAMGSSLAACSRIRAGTRVPHPRHWAVLKQMLGGEGRP